jgi:hypothetical protein
MSFIENVKSALGFVTKENPSWLKSEEGFLLHFGCEFEDFNEVYELLSESQKQLFAKTVAINPEAAVLWVLAMDENDRLENDVDM